MADTEKIEAIATEALRKQRDAERREASNHTERVDTDDLPITRRQIRLGWALVVVLGGAVITGAGYLWTTATSQADQRNAIAQNAQEIASLKEWRKERSREAARAEVQVAASLADINAKLQNIQAALDDLQRDRRRR